MARRLPARFLLRSSRRAVLAMCVLPALAVASAAETWRDAPLVAARYGNPTTRYPHGVLGDRVEYGALELDYGAQTFRIVLPQTRVFEDVAPRLADVDGDGQSEAVVVESDSQQGARLAIYNAAGLMAATPFIGTRFRWLAPIGIGDLDGDGHVELAYIDRPHLAKTLRVWRFRAGALEPVANRPGLTNHRIGEPDIAGGLRDCGSGPEMITADSGWRRLVSSQLIGTDIVSRDIGAHRGRASFADALNCP
ncbi:MAG: FG-GAP repeat domain-containing protein [Sedimentitalea sp.]